MTMLVSISTTRDKLKVLAGARGSHGLFLSVTLSTSRLDDWRQFAPTFLKSEFSRIAREREFPKEERRILQDDFQKVLEVLQYEVTRKTQGLAVFADGGGGVFERMELPMRLVNRLVVEPSPYVRPLVHALSLLEPFVVVRVSRDDSSVYLLDEWRVSREDDFVGPYLRSSDRETGELSVKEYYAAARQDALVDQHFKDVSGALAKLVDETRVRRVVICGQHDIASGFRKALPQATASHVVAEIPWDAAATPSQMLLAAREALDAARRNEITELAGKMKEGLGSNGRGVAGFDQVMAALGRRQVHTLLVDRNYRVPGWRCLECDWVGLTAAATCPVCSGPVTPVADAIGEAVRLGVLQGALVDVGEDIPVLDELGGLAALLRYA